MNILLAGPNGFVGARIRDALNVVPSPFLRNAAEDEVRRLVDSVMPDVIVHTAGTSS